jgi:hypothetical protein
MKLLLLSFLIPFAAFSQTTPATQSKNSEIIELRKKVEELSEVSNEHSELMKRQIKDQHFDQNSRGYIEVKFGRSSFNPKDVEEENDDVFNDLDDANWEKFDYANLVEFEIGKAIEDEGLKHEIGIGYQHFRSKKLQADYSPSGGGGKVKITETALAHTLFARYSMLFTSKNQKGFYFGPGITLGYAPVTKLMIEAEQGDAGAQIYGENTSYLLEVFAKGKLEIKRYFSIVFISGYRMQEAENLKLNAAEIVTIKTRTDLDLSGFYGTFGIATSF